MSQAGLKIKTIGGDDILRKALSTDLLSYAKWTTNKLFKALILVKIRLVLLRIYINVANLLSI